MSYPKEATIYDAMPCPFCGKQPVIEKWHGRGPLTRRIGCDNDDCFVCPDVVGPTKRKALSRWNTRMGAQP